MPKGKKKDRHGYKGKSNRLQAGSEDEAETVDTVSAVGSLSDQQSATITDGSTDMEVDEMSAQDNLEEKLHMLIEGISQKSAKGRVESLQSLKAILCQKYLIDFISQNKLTISECLERSLKKGKCDEQRAAALCTMLILVQLGASNVREDIYKLFFPVLRIVLTDSSASCCARSMCADAIGLCTFIAAEENQMVCETMEVLENVFKQAYGKSTPQASPDVSSMQNHALASWSLLLTIAPGSFIRNLAETHLCKLSDVLSSIDMELRITAGEAIALLYEKYREMEEDFQDPGFEELCTSLKALSTECNKFRAKKDRRQQKSSFRDILSGVATGEFSPQNIKVGPLESILIDSWTIKTQYDALCHVLGPGMSVHLQENPLLRDVFGLGPPAPQDSLPGTKSSKIERQMIHDAAFKARTKCIKKLRDIKSNGTAGD